MFWHGGTSYVVGRGEALRSGFKVAASCSTKALDRNNLFSLSLFYLPFY